MFRHTHTSSVENRRHSVHILYEHTAIKQKIIKNLKQKELLTLWVKKIQTNYKISTK